MEVSLIPNIYGTADLGAAQVEIFLKRGSLERNVTPQRRIGKPDFMLEPGLRKIERCGNHCVFEIQRSLEPGTNDVDRAVR